MRPILPESLKQSVTIKRHTAGTRNTATTIASGVTIFIEPVSYRSQLENQRIGVDADFQAVVSSPVAGVRNRDVVVDAASVEYAILQVRTLGDVQEYLLKKREVI